MYDPPIDNFQHDTRIPLCDSCVFGKFIEGYYDPSIYPTQMPEHFWWKCYLGAMKGCYEHCPEEEFVRECDDYKKITCTCTPYHSNETGTIEERMCDYCKEKSSDGKPF